MALRDLADVINEIRELVRSKGYIYCLCLTIMDDFHFNVEKMHEVDNWNRLNRNEVSLLIGFLIQSPISLDPPNDPFDLIELQNKTYSLMLQLHNAANQPMIDRFNKFYQNQDAGRNLIKKNFLEEKIHSLKQSFIQAMACMISNTLNIWIRNTNMMING